MRINKPKTKRSKTEKPGAERTGAEKQNAEKPGAERAGAEKPGAERAGAEKQDAEKLLAEGNSIQIHPQGWSMYPMLVPGRDSAILEPVEPENLKRGDVALYRREGSILVLHRVWKHGPEGFYMVGDNQTAIEGPLPGTCMRGRLAAFVRKGKFIPATHPVYRTVSAVWLWMRPVRRYVAKTVSFFRKLFGRK